ncbi:unnamed protein product [Periconia digitata]|uniref:Uncharacterized protein n=1 Tax=Periconia digitata TaxID=1303443 RepID=A0A9W4XLK2_9PLEO|nr:unnamed protein product [Periconia digitata]
MEQGTNIFLADVAAGLDDASRDRRKEILRVFWPERTALHTLVDEASYASFFQYFHREISQLQPYRRYFAVQDLKGLFGIVRMLQMNPKQSKSRIVEQLSSHFSNAEPTALHRSLELSVRLWLTINVNSTTIAVGPTFPDESPLEWEPNLSLHDLVERQFGQGIQANGKGRRWQIDATLTAAYLVNNCGMSISWTDSISDHLRFDPTSQVLSIYRHKVCLANHLDTPESCPVPKYVLAEILDTLNVLLPFGDFATKQLLIKKNQQPLYRLGSCGRARNLELTQYRYFREELEYLIEAFNRPPRTWKQLALDKRNKPEWAAFWVTVMVAFLTLVSIPCSIIQAVYSVKSYNIAVAQAK